jgi:hypothetical protein
MSEPLLKIRNSHAVACGDPPIVAAEDPNIYVGYFQNVFGEQWIFTYDYRTKNAELRGGDIGWNTAYDVIDGVAPSLVLNRDEQDWLKACWRAASGIDHET